MDEARPAIQLPCVRLRRFGEVCCKNGRGKARDRTPPRTASPRVRPPATQGGNYLEVCPGLTLHEWRWLRLGGCSGKGFGVCPGLALHEWSRSARRLDSRPVKRKRGKALEIVAPLRACEWGGGCAAQPRTGGLGCGPCLVPTDNTPTQTDEVGHRGVGSRASPRLHLQPLPTREARRGGEGSIPSSQRKDRPDVGMKAA